jgi:hypothetical protein
LPDACHLSIKHTVLGLRSTVPTEEKTALRPSSDPHCEIPALLNEKVIVPTSH